MIFVKSVFSKFQNGMHNFNPNHNCVQNFSSLSLEATEKSTRQILSTAAAATPRDRQIFFCSKHDFSEVKIKLSHISYEEVKMSKTLEKSQELPLLWLNTS
jgi:hypothetical protein